MKEFEHIPVLLQECIDGLKVKKIMYNIKKGF